MKFKCEVCIDVKTCTSDVFLKSKMLRKYILENTGDNDLFP